MGYPRNDSGSMPFSSEDMVKRLLPCRAMLTELIFLFWSNLAGNAYPMVRERNRK